MPQTITPDFSRISEVYALAAKAQVDFKLSYNEGSQSWDFEISSAAPGECSLGRDYGNFEVAVDDVISRLKKLLPK